MPEKKKTKQVANFFKERNKPSKIETFFKGLFSQKNEGKPLAKKLTESIKKRRLTNNHK